MGFKTKIRVFMQRAASWLSGLSFRTGVVVLLLCVPCYIFSFAQAALPISVAWKSALFVIFFGLAKTFQYGGMLILGKEGVKRLKAFFRKKKNRDLTFCVALFALLLSACGHSDDPITEEEEITSQIVFLFSPGGLGDMSYNDCILQGVQQFKKANPQVDVFMSSPNSIEEVERIFTDWLKRPGSNIPVLFVLASSDYDQLAQKYLDEYELTPNKSLLIFESLMHYDQPRVHTFQISMYGASYLAGACAREIGEGRKSLVLLGSSTDIPIRSAEDGFIHGHGGECDVECMADDWHGFVMPSEAYRKMEIWSPAYGFIFPVAGGTNSGIYRYSREFADCPYLAGMDVDQSGMSSKITGSVVKHFDRLIVEYLTDWYYTGTMPESQIYGLESGYADWLLSPRYREALSEVVERNRADAIKSEKVYYELGD